MSDYYDVNEGADQLYADDGSDPNTYVIVNGSKKSIIPGVSFKDTIKNYAQDAGLGKFRVFLNGNEVKGPNTAPENITEGSKIEIRPYDIAG